MRLPRSTIDEALRVAFLLHPGGETSEFQDLPHLLGSHGLAPTLAALPKAWKNRDNLDCFLSGLWDLGVRPEHVKPSNTADYILASHSAMQLAEAFKRCDGYALESQVRPIKKLLQREQGLPHWAALIPEKMPERASAWDNPRFALDFGFVVDDLDDKADFFNRVVKVGQSERYQRAYARHSSSLEIPTAYSEALELSRPMLGMSNPSLFETAITLMVPYGVPFIPGSACKGLARALGRYAYDNGYRFTLEANVEATLDQLFGSESTDDSSAGRLRCLDAWWVPGSAPGIANSPLVREQITPHHKNFRDAHMGNQPNPDVFPTPFDSPTPIAQLAAHGKFLFAMEAVEPKDSFALQIAFALLKWGLEDEGIGAKRFSHGRVLTQ